MNWRLTEIIPLKILRSRLRGLLPLFCLLIILTSGFVGLASTSFAGDLSIKVDLEKDRFTIAEPVRFTLTIAAQKGVEFFTPDERIPLYPFEVIGYRILEDGEEFKRIEYLITNYDIGEFELPSLILPYKDRFGETREVSTRPIRVVVEGVAPLEAEELKGIRGPMEPDELESAHKKGSFWIIPSLVAGILLAIAIPLLLRRKMKRNFSDVKTQTPSPLEEAIEELNRIRSMGLLEKGEAKRYHLLIADAIKRYIANRFSLQVGVMTTEELMNEIKAIVKSDGKIDLLFELLADLDLVKFSDYKPSIEEAEEVIDRAKETITYYEVC